MADLPDEVVERAAEAIYDRFVYDRPTGAKPAWVPGGNSDKQHEARMLARAALSAGLPGMATRLRGENERLRGVIERDRTKVAEGIGAIVSTLGSRAWMRESRGPYAWDDARYQSEFSDALDEIHASLDTLRPIALDWSDCPTDPIDIAAARALAERIKQEVGT